MIATQSSLTLNLTTAFGAYMIAGGLTGFIARENWSAIIEEFRERPALTFVTGVFVYVMGVALILTHNSWTDPLAGFISFVGWAAAVEGLVLIAFPGPLLKISTAFLRPAVITTFAGGTMLAGLFLLFAGLTGTAG